MNRWLRLRSLHPKHLLQSIEIGSRVKQIRLTKPHALPNNSSGYMIAAHCYEKPLQAYTDLGKYSDKVEELKVKITEANEAALETEYNAISSTVPIPTEAINKYVDTYRSLGIDQIFEALSMDPNLIPSYEQEREKAIKQAEEFALSQLFPVAIMKGMNRPVDRSKIARPRKYLSQPFRSIE